MRSSDFEQIPAWARWVAQDANGAWWAFEHEPNEGATSWYENEVGRYQLIGKDVPSTDWRNSLSKVSD